MDSRQRTNLVGGIFLIALGVLFFLFRFMPGLRIWFNLQFSWPFFVIGTGLLLLILAVLLSAPGMAIPACIVGGIGLLLYYQNITGNWGSWAYAWALIPGFAGVGTLLAGALGMHPRQSFREGLNLIVVSAVLFLIFGSFLGGFGLLGSYWPVLLILLGAWLLIRPLLLGRKS